MRARLGVATLIGLFGPLGCALALGLDEYEDDRFCGDVSDCPPSTDCLLSLCVQRRCQVELLPRYTPCDEHGGEVCNGSGRCVSGDGRACSEETTCASGYCVDGVCCREACDGICSQCIVEPGVCAPVPPGEPDVGECSTPSVCDGGGLCVDGEAVAAATLGGMGSDPARGVTLTDDGGVVITGSVGAALTFDGEAVPFGGPMEDTFTAKFNGAGAPVWIDVVGDATDNRGQVAATVPGGPVVVGGSFVGAITLAGEALMGTAAAFSPYVVALAQGSGQQLWGLAWPDTSAGALGHGEVLAIESAGADLLVAGYVASATDFGDGSGAIGANGAHDGFLLRIDPVLGAVSSALAFGGPGSDVVRGLAADGERKTVLVGTATAAPDFGGGALPHSGDTLADPFVVALDPSGAHLWSRGFTAPGGHAFFRGVATDAAGDVFVAGWTHAALVVGEEVIALAGDRVGFVLKLDGETGAVVWHRALPATGSSYCHSVAVDDDGHLYVVGAAVGAIDFGDGEPTPMVGVSEAWLAAYNTDGALMFTRRFGATDGVQEGLEVAHREGALAMAGFFGGGLNARGTLYQPPSDQADAFLVLFDL